VQLIATKKRKAENKTRT